MTNGGQAGDNLETMTNAHARTNSNALPMETVNGSKLVVIVARLLPDRHRFVTCAGLH